MARGWKRSWVKFLVDECLDGSIREELTPAERGVWYDLIITRQSVGYQGLFPPMRHSQFLDIDWLVS